MGSPTPQPHTGEQLAGVVIDAGGEPPREIKEKEAAGLQRSDPAHPSPAVGRAGSRLGGTSPAPGRTSPLSTARGTRPRPSGTELTGHGCQPHNAWRRDQHKH